MYNHLSVVGVGLESKAWNSRFGLLYMECAVVFGTSGGLLPCREWQPNIVQSGTVIVLAYRDVFLVNPLQSVSALTNKTGIPTPPKVAAPVSAFAVVDIEI